MMKKYISLLSDLCYLPNCINEVTQLRQVCHRSSQTSSITDASSYKYMTLSAVPPDLRPYVKLLLDVLGDSAKALWLFGSRANGTNRPDSDWDLLLYSDAEGLEKLKRTNLHRPDIDLQMDVGEENWIEPWPENPGNPKKLFADVLNWEITAPGRASYLDRPRYGSRQDWWKESTPSQEKFCAYQIWP